MEGLICEFCNNKFKNISNLNNHKKRTKYCIELQKQKNSEVSNYLTECQYCSKSFSSHIFKRHLETCKLKKENCITVLEERNKFLEDRNKFLEEKYISQSKLIEEIQYELKSKDELIEFIKRKINNEIDIKNSLKEEIAGLKAKNEIYEVEHKCILDIAKQPKNITNTNNKILAIQTSLNLNDIDYVKNALENNYKVDYILDGQKGLAEFAVENILKDENGKLKYVCTDPSRQIFKYKDELGDIQKDIQAKKLTNYLVDGGIKIKCSNLASDWWTNDDGCQDFEKYQLLFEKANEIRNVKNDNSKFKKELVAMTTI
jgi:hypothetical protein